MSDKLLCSHCLEDKIKILDDGWLCENCGQHGEYTGIPCENPKEALEMNVPWTMPENIFSPTHRDDVPMDLAEAIEKAVGEQHPGFKVVYSGDLPDEKIPPEVKEFMENMEQQCKTALVEGRCMDCGKKYPGKWPLGDDDEFEPGWEMFFTLKNTPLGISCPECEASIPELGGEEEDEK